MKKKIVRNELLQESWPKEEEVKLFNIYAARFILPRLQGLIQIENGENGIYPSIISEPDPFRKWISYLKKMINTLSVFSIPNGYISLTEQEKIEIMKGLKLFADYYDCLWN